MSKQPAPESQAAPYVGVQKSGRDRRDGFIQAAMYCVRSWFLYGEHDNSETAAKAVEIADAVMAVADKAEKENEDDEMCKV